MSKLDMNMSLLVKHGSVILEGREEVEDIEAELKEFYSSLTYTIDNLENDNYYLIITNWRVQ